ncbi:hypothetical protein HPB50_020832 [Hyalomma asiaticum]|uniref:Uncharacterized protein n=1 Tax=Hyalomma asiaticum TaxID=266040 RepID=A0ACB7RVY9_HYAAI|nr:hypothetical protein HPB50_020832 [Hyalomma asiaticum]
MLKTLKPVARTVLMCVEEVIIPKRVPGEFALATRAGRNESMLCTVAYVEQHLTYIYSDKDGGAGTQRFEQPTTLYILLATGERTMLMVLKPVARTVLVCLDEVVFPKRPPGEFLMADLNYLSGYPTFLECPDGRFRIPIHPVSPSVLHGECYGHFLGHYRIRRPKRGTVDDFAQRVYYGNRKSLAAACSRGSCLATTGVVHGLDIAVQRGYNELLPYFSRELGVASQVIGRGESDLLKDPPAGWRDGQPS